MLKYFVTLFWSFFIKSTSLEKQENECHVIKACTSIMYVRKDPPQKGEELTACRAREG